ncbi:hypothetical protein BGZ60DRAFT_530630 [Tricladium varicosporioides]|nr:hypothetical protein BGZ60DRAFT_530630 [Hymenoscyphus varicosporioides]
MVKFGALFLVSLPFVLSAAVASNDTYDYIVIGSGPGGGTLAANLAKAGESVLLLEAGDDQGENLNEIVPGFFPLVKDDPLVRWDFFVKYHTDDAITNKYDHLTWRTTDGKFYVGTTPPAGATRLGVYYPRTGTLGGCSTHNAMCAPLPSNNDWQYIADLTGDKSWEPKKMRQHYIDLENNHLVPKGTPGHGFSGFLDITVNGPELLQNQSQAYDILQAAAKVMGQDPTKVYDLLQRDMNSDDADRDQQTGLFGFPAHRSPAGKRVSARDAVVLVRDAKTASGAKKYDFTVAMHSFATKIIFDTKGKTIKAKGVEYLQGQSMYAADPRFNATSKGTKKQVFARKEVIVSGGTFNSPQLLMLSGIGPKADLEKLKIPVLVNLPGVGANLQDNVEMGVAATASAVIASKGPSCTYNNGNDPCLAAWRESKGPYTQGPLDAILAKSSVSKERDLFFFGLPNTVFRGYWPAETVNVVPSDDPNVFDFSMVKMFPQSRGYLKLTSANPQDVPEINFKFYEEGTTDLQGLADGVELGRKIFDSMSGPLAPFTETCPCKGNRNCDLKETIKAQTWSHHATSTCAIGADNDTMAVLDSKFRVRGVEGLRVVDASSFPKTPGAFPVVPTFMLGMKAAVVILEDNKS